MSKTVEARCAPGHTFGQAVQLTNQRFAKWARTAFQLFGRYEKVTAAVVRAHVLACSSSPTRACLYRVQLTARLMNKSVLDPHATELLLRARQGYTQRMLCLYLQHEKLLRISQPSLSRWLAAQSFKVDRPADEELHRYQQLAALVLTPRRYRRTLSKWRGHIEHLRKRGNSLSEIQADLKKHGVSASIRTIRRELGTV